MNLNFEFIELIEKELEKSKKSGNSELINLYEDLLMKLYKIVEKNMN